METFVDLHNHLDLVRHDLRMEQEALQRAMRRDVDEQDILDFIYALNGQIAGVVEVLRSLIPNPL